MAEGGDDVEVEQTPGYKAPKKVDLETLQNLDKDDEALNRWKAKLLEGVAKGRLLVGVQGRVQRRIPAAPCVVLLCCVCFGLYHESERERERES